MCSVVLRREGKHILNDERNPVHGLGKGNICLPVLRDGWTRVHRQGWGASAGTLLLYINRLVCASLQTEHRISTLLNERAFVFNNKSLLLLPQFWTSSDYRYSATTLYLSAFGERTAACLIKTGAMKLCLLVASLSALIE